MRAFQKGKGFLCLSLLQESVECKDPVSQVVPEEGQFFPVILQDLGIGLEEGNGFLHQVVCTLEIRQIFKVFLFQNDVSVKGDEENGEDQPDKEFIRRPELAKETCGGGGNDGLCTERVSIGKK